MCAQLINIVTRLKTAWDSLAQGREHKEQISSLSEPWTAVLQLHCYQKHSFIYLAFLPSIHAALSHLYQSIHTFTSLFHFFTDKYVIFTVLLKSNAVITHACILVILHIKSLQNTQYIWREQGLEKIVFCLPYLWIIVQCTHSVQQGVLTFTVDCSDKATRSHLFSLSFYS